MLSLPFFRFQKIEYNFIGAKIIIKNNSHIINNVIYWHNKLNLITSKSLIVLTAKSVYYSQYFPFNEIN